MSESEDREKMTLMILLLLQLTSCVCVGRFVVNVTQTSYQAEENQNITLEWTFITKTDSSPKNLFIFCEHFTDHKNPIVFRLHEGVEVSQSQDAQFAGRVQCDKDVLREGRLRLHVSRLRTEDSGEYLCEVTTNDGVGFKTCRLNVTAAADEPEPQRPTERPEPESRWRIGLYAGLTAALVVCVGLFFVFRPNNEGKSICSFAPGPTRGSGDISVTTSELQNLSENQDTDSRTLQHVSSCEDRTF